MTSLAEASYGQLPGELSNQDAMTAAFVGNGFSQSQISDFLRKYLALDHLPNTSSGLSATLFQEKGRLI